MKKIYILTAILGLSLGLAAQETVTKKVASTKKTKTTKTTAKQATAPATPTIDVAPKVDEHAGHNHAKAVSDAPVTTTVAPAVDMAKPLGEDNLTLKEANYDFGKIPQGKPVTHDFAFSNTGKTELKLDDVRAGCGCTTPTWKPGPYKAGETAVINVGFNAGAVGAFTKSVTITYNGGLTKVITFNGEVLAAPATPAPENKSVQILKGN